MSKLKDKLKYLVIGLVGLLLYPGLSAAKYGDNLNRLFPRQVCSMEFRDADVKNVLRSLAEPYKINIFVSKGVSGTITASFENVYAKDVFIAVLRDVGLDYIIQGNILRVDTFQALADKRKMAPLITRSKEVTYAFDSSSTKDLTNMATELKKMLSGKAGSGISVIPRNNTLIVTDLPEYIDKVFAMIETLDTESPQVAIVAKIVEMNADYSKDLGIQWGGKLSVGGDTMTGKDDVFAARGGSMMGTGPSSGENFLVNLPAPVGQGAGGAINFLIGKIGSEILELQLSAMEQEGKGKIISNPKIITQDNQKAYIESGDEIPYTTLQEGGAFEVSFKEAVVGLEVTPHVIGNKIFMEVLIKKDSVDFTKAVGIGQEPPIKTNELNTKVLVADGETVVIGGLINKSDSLEEGGVPFLRDIPLIGRLFSFKKKKNADTELIIFITPSILRQG